MRSVALCAVLVLLTVPFACIPVPGQEAACGVPRAGGEPPWPTYHGDEARTGNSSVAGPETNHMLWSNGTGQYSYASPAMAGGKVYIPADDASIYCFWASNGTRIWRTVLSEPAWASPAVDVANDRVYVCDGTGLDFSTTHSIYGLNASTGAQIWKKPLADYGESSPVINGNTVIVGTGDDYVGTTSNNLYCFNSTNGNQVWATASAGSCAAPAIADGRVYSVGNGLLRCLDPATGAFIWNASVSQGYGSPSVAEGKVFYPGGNGRIFAFHAPNGTKAWETGSGYPESYSTCAISNGSVFVCAGQAGGAGALVKLDAANGGVTWTYATAAGSTPWGAPVVSGERAYFCYGRTIACINVTDHTQVWSYQGAAGNSQYGIGSSPSLGYGRLYVGGAESKLYCFGPAAPNTPPASLALQPPSEVRETSMILRWSPSSETDFARYEIYKSTITPVLPIPANLAATITQMAQNWTNVTDLNYSTTYHFRVRVWDNGDPNMFNDSNEVEATTATPNGAPAAVVLYPAGDVGPFSLKLYWSTNADSDFSRYEVHRGLTKGFSPAAPTLLSTITDRDQNSTLVESLKPWTSYFFRVRVLDNGTPALRNDSNELEVRTGNTPPAAVVLNQVQMGATSADLGWSASTDDDFARYEVHLSQNASFAPGPDTLAATLSGKLDTAYTVESLQLARTYHFLVRTVDQGGLGNDSNIETGTTMNTVPKPVISTPEDNDVYDTRTLIVFNGSASTDQDRDPLSFYWTSSIDGFLSKMAAFTAVLSEGSHRVTLFVNDGNGHNVSARISITVNKAPDRPPVVNVLFPIENNELSGIAGLHGTAWDPDGNDTLAAVEFSVDKGDWKAVTGTSNWSLDWNSSKLANGKHKISFRAFDGELYSQEVTLSVKVNNVIMNLRPLVAITGPPATKAFFGIVTVTGTASDPEGKLARVEMSINGGGWSPLTGAASWSYLLDTTSLRNGRHSIQVRAFDGTDYSDAAWLNFTVSNAAPSTSTGPSPLMLAGIGVIILVVVAAILLTRRRRPNATGAIPATAPVESPAPPAMPYQPQTAEAPYQYQQPSEGQQYAPQDGYQRPWEAQPYEQQDGALQPPEPQAPSMQDSTRVGPQDN